MDSGSFTFEFKEGQIVVTLQSARLDNFYERMFRKAYRRVRSSRKPVEAGISIIVFGAFWLEAYANVFLREALNLETTSSAFGKVLWNILRRSALLEKLELFKALAPDRLATQFSEVHTGVKRLLDMRNGLAHFKEEPIQLGGPYTDINDALMEFLTAGEPSRIKELQAPAVLKHGHAVLAAYRWMYRVQRFHAKTHGFYMETGKRPSKYVNRLLGIPQACT